MRVSGAALVDVDDQVAELVRAGVGVGHDLDLARGGSAPGRSCAAASGSRMPKAMVAVECVCTTPCTSGRIARMPACQRCSFDGFHGPGLICFPARSISTMFSTAVSRKVTPVAVQR